MRFVLLFSLLLLSCDEKRESPRKEDNTPAAKRSPIAAPPLSPTRELEKIIEAGGFPEKDVLARILSVDSMEDRISLLESFIVKMSGEGKTPLLIELIQESFGPGDQRAVIMSSAFRYSTLAIPELLQLRAKFSEPRDLSSASFGITKRIANSGVKELSIEDIPIESRSDFSKILFDGLTIRLQIVGIQQGDLAAFMEKSLATLKSFGGSDADGSVNRFCSEAARIKPFEVWEILSDKKITVSDPATLLAIVNQMADRDPKKTMETVSNDGHGPESQLAYLKWLKFDSKAAAEWMAAHDVGLSATVRDNLYGASVEYHASTDPAASKEWLARIEDPTLRENTQRKFDEIQLRSINDTSQKNPRAAVDMILSPSSPYSEYLLENAVANWIKSKPEEAEKWSQSNLEKLPVSKQQYVAAAYARAAIEAGDLEVAKQWAGRLRDQHLIDSIEAELAPLDIK